MSKALEPSVQDRCHCKL